MDDKEFEEIKKDWTDDRIAYLTMQLLQTRPVSIIQQLIAYCEELREREIGWTMTLSSLEEENAKLKLEIDEWSSTSTVDTKRNQEILAVAKIHAEENKKLKAILLAYLEIPIKELKESKIAHRVVGKEYW